MQDTRAAVGHRFQYGLLLFVLTAAGTLQAVLLFLAGLLLAAGTMLGRLPLQILGLAVLLGIATRLRRLSGTPSGPAVAATTAGSTS